MTVKLIFKLCNGRENSRWLVKLDDDSLKSVKLSNNKKLSINDKIEVDTDCLEDVKGQQIDRYFKYLSSTNNIKEHLTEYAKNRELEIGGKWNGKEYSHILQDEKKNLLLGFVYDDKLNEIYSKQKAQGHIHIGFAHLNSSQAFAFNFFAPLVEEAEKGLNLFGKLLGDDNLPLPQKSEFEKELSEVWNSIRFLSKFWQ